MIRRYTRGGLGFFGQSLPPPPPPKFPAEFKNGKWDCSAYAKPEGDEKSFYYCCPSGWTKTAYNDPKPCKGKDGEKFVCGPLPEGAKETDVICCEQMKEWAVGTTPSACVQAALQSGRAVPGVMETMLAKDVETKSGIASPVFIVVVILAAIGMVVVALVGH